MTKCCIYNFGQCNTTLQCDNDNLNGFNLLTGKAPFPIFPCRLYVWLVMSLICSKSIFGAYKVR